MSQSFVRGSALMAGAGLAATSLAMIPAGAFAAADCGPDGTEITTGICEVSFTTAGNYTFTPPSGVSKLAAVIVGAGGGSLYSSNWGQAYGGGGGEVVFTDTLPTTGTLTITVGAGAAAFNGDGGQVEADNGEDSSVDSTVALGGYGAGWQNLGSGYLDVGGSSGNGNFGSVNNYFNTGAGGGAGQAASDCYTGANLQTCPGGLGLTASDVSSDSTLFPSVLGEPEYGIGGNGIPGLNPTSVGSYDAGHGGDAISNSAGDDGNDGAVFLRWAAPALPDTGMTVQPWMIGTAAAAVAAGAIFTSGLLRTRRKGRHSA